MVDRNYVLDKMKSKIMTVGEFDYDRLMAPPLYSLLSYDDIDQLHRIATSLRYSARPTEKLNAIDKIMVNRGFRKFGGGTNRVVYKFLEDDRFVIKIATCNVALDDSPREFLNQEYLKPFCSKCFEVSPCGTVGLFERVLPITSREEFVSIADMVYDLITNIFTGTCVMDDIGTEYFMNYGVRNGFGAVILDYTYRYQLDGNKLYCNNILPNGEHCGGVIDYDSGYNHLRCTKCGRVYKAVELKKDIENSMVIQKGGKYKMKVALIQGDTTVYTNTDDYVDTSTKLVGKRKGKGTKIGKLKIKLPGVDEPIDVTEEDEPVHTLNVRGMVVHNQVAETTDDNDEEEHDEPEKVIDVEEDEVRYIPAYNELSASTFGSRELFGNNPDIPRFKCLALFDEDGNMMEDEEGSIYIITSIDDRNLDDIVVLDRSYYNKLVNEANHTSYDDPTPPENESSSEDDGLPYYTDEEGVKRWKGNHNVYKREDVPVGASTTAVNSEIVDAIEEQLADDGKPKKKSSKKKRR